jgi:hypothetical protein
MPSDRDPRTDPRPGDVLEKIFANGRKRRRRVFICRREKVEYSVPSRIAHSLCWLTHWRQWAKGTTVIARGAY